ncbi:MAG: hypothetical protein F6J95_005695 [Leptolyngbya sp. SIO1E4]|nr:hypothetical protein [Leptolyngbya sp. SIO1E4]
MRVYTNQFVRNLWAYTKLAATIVVLYVVISQSAQIWSDEPAIQQFKDLVEKVQ